MDFSLIVEENGIKNEYIQDIVKRSYEMGYECVALNTVVSSANLSGKDINIPEPKYINFDVKSGRKFRIFNRLTAVVEDPIHAHHLMRSPVTKKYDILAIQPVGEKVFHHVVSQVDVEILCLNLSEDLGFSLKSSHIRLGFQKNICFEISYGPCLRSQTSKRFIISNSQKLVNVCKGKNIIISSGALRALELKSPDDVVNLGLLFDLNKNQAVGAVKINGDTIISHAGTRRNTGCGILSVTSNIKIPKEQGWITKLIAVPPRAEEPLKNINKRFYEHMENPVSKKQKTEQSN